MAVASGVRASPFRASVRAGDPAGSLAETLLAKTLTKAPVDTTRLPKLHNTTQPYRQTLLRKGNPLYNGCFLLTDIAAPLKYSL